MYTTTQGNFDSGGVSSTVWAQGAYGSGSVVSMGTATTEALAKLPNPVISTMTEDGASGTGTPGASVVIRDAGNNVICSTTVETDGSWSCPFTGESIPVTDDVVSVVQEKDGIITSEPETVSVTPGKSIAPVVEETTEKWVPGTGSPGSQIDITNTGGDVLCTTTVEPDGSWTCVFDEANQPAAGETVSVTQLQSGKTLSDPVDETVLLNSETPIVDVITSASGSGTGVPGAEIVIRDADGAELCSTTVGSDGLWTCEFTGTQPAIGDPVTVIQTEPGKGTSEPAPSTVLEKLATPVVEVLAPYGASGSGTPGANVVIRNESGDVLCSTTVEADGSWSCTFEGENVPATGEKLNVKQEKDGMAPSDPVSGGVVGGEVSLEGSPIGGQTLTADTSKFPAGTTFKYVWEMASSSGFDDPVAISGEDAQTLTLGGTEVNKWIRVRVIATSPEGISAEFTTDPVGPIESISLRIGGADRYATDAKVIEKYAKKGKPLFIATGQTLADALTAGPAAAKLDGAIALTRSTTLSSAALSAIKYIKPSEIVIVGQTVSISREIEQQLRDLGVKVSRVGGNDRYQTSIDVFNKYMKDSAPVVYIASGRNFTDALVSGPAASLSNGAVLLIDGKEGSTGTTVKNANNALKNSHVTSVVVAGGPVSVSEDAKTAIKQTISNTTRVGGADRFETSVLINQVFPKTTDQIWVTSGRVFADAVSAAAPAGRFKSPVYLSEPTCLPKVVSDAITDTTRRYAERIFVGQTQTLSNQVMSMNVCGE